MSSSNSLRAISALALALSLTFPIGCGRAAPEATPSFATSSRASSSSADASQSTSAIEGTRQRIVHVSTTLGVDSVSSSAARLRRLVARHGGYVESATERRDEDGSASFVLRIPSARIATFRAEMRRLGDVELDEERVEDVTEQHADLAARLRNARAQEARLAALLESRTGSLADVIAITAEIGRVRETIERYEASARLLDAQIAYADVTVTMRPHAIAFWQEPGRNIADAATFGARTVCAIAVGAVMAIAAIGPTALAGLVAILALVVLARLAFRRRTVVRSA